MRRESPILSALAFRTLLLLSILVSLGAEASPSMNPNTQDVISDLIRQAKQKYFTGQSVARELTEDKIALFESGKNAADRVLALSPTHKDALLWWSANAGSIARLKRNLRALGTIKEIEAKMGKLRELDASFGFSAAYRVLGVLYHEAPGIVSIGNNRKAEECLRAAVKVSPQFPGNKLALAEFLLDEGKRSEAFSLVSELSVDLAKSQTRFGDFEPDRERWKSRLVRLKAEVGKP